MKRLGWTLTALIIAAAVANLNLTVALVALPAIGTSFEASQVQLNLVAVGYSLGLAGSVLYLGAVGDRYGRKALLLIGTLAAIPCSLLAAYAPTVEFLAVARVLGGVAAGAAYPTTLSLISAVWPEGAARTRAIALWSACGGASAALGPLVGGALLTTFWWGSVFLFTIPLAVLAVILVWVSVPSGVNQGTEPVDHLSGVLSILTIGSLILAINLLPQPGRMTLALALLGASIVLGALFVWRQLAGTHPLYDLRVAARRTFWVAGVAGIIVFGAFMGAVFIGSQYVQDVLGYSALESGFTTVPFAIFMVVAAPLSAKLIAKHGSRLTLLAGYTAFLLGFLVMLLFWGEGTALWVVLAAYVILGVGTGLAGTPAARSLTGSVPVEKVGMASGTADLQRDLGGSLLQSAMGALLTAGYASAFAATIAAQGDKISSQVQSVLLESYSGAEAVAQRYPEYAQQIIDAARQAFLTGDQWAYLLTIVCVLGGGILVALAFPRKQQELELLEQYAKADATVPDPSP